jgi:hypothetical protein
MADKDGLSSLKEPVAQATGSFLLQFRVSENSHASAMG